MMTSSFLFFAEWLRKARGVHVKKWNKHRSSYNFLSTSALMTRWFQVWTAPRVCTFFEPIHGSKEMVGMVAEMGVDQHDKVCRVNYRYSTKRLFLSTRMHFGVIGESEKANPITMISSPALIRCAAAPFMHMTPLFRSPLMI